MTLSEYNLKLDLEMVMLTQIPRIREGSGNLMGRVFSENPTLFLEMGNLFFGQNGVGFWGSKWGNSCLPQSPTYSHYYHFTFGIFYSLTFYSLTYIFEFTSETSERERTCK